MYRRSPRASQHVVDTAANVQTFTASSTGPNIALGTKWPLLADSVARILRVSGQVIAADIGFIIPTAMVIQAYLLDASLAQIKNANGAILAIDLAQFIYPASTGGLADMLAAGANAGFNISASDDPLLELVSGIMVTGFTAVSGVLVGGFQVALTCDVSNQDSGASHSCQAILNSVISFAPRER